MLNKEQLNAVNHYRGPALILAVPGAGKTTVLIHRTANLINKHKINPNNILSITFSKASAMDMKSRFNNFFPDLSKDVFFSTIHSFCFRLIRHYSHISKESFELLEGRSDHLSKYNILKNLHIKINGYPIQEDKLELLLNSIGYVKNMMLDNFQGLKNYSVDIANFSEIFSSYESFKRENKLIDFDDMLSLSYKILRSNPELLKSYQDYFQFIQVDEGQDTSKIQLEIVKLLAKPSNNLLIVADDDQSIYGFRGAYPKGLFDFTKDYKDAKLYFMEQNYRSSKNIVSASDKLIKNNIRRFNKDLFTENDFLEPLNIVRLNDSKDQYEYILRDLREKPNSTSCVLYRNNLSSINLVDILEKNKIPFYIKDKDLKFFNHWIIGDIINFILFSQDQNNIELYEKIYYKKKGYISRKQINYAKKSFNEISVFKKIKDFPGIKAFYIRTLNQLEDDFKTLSKLKPREAIDFISYELGYLEYLKDNSQKFGYNFRNLRTILFSLKNIASGLNTLDEFMDRLDSLKILCKESKPGEAQVTLSTIHSSKGLEFDNVYLIDLIDGDFPSKSSIDSFEEGLFDDLEEERRLFYVAMTRAKYFLSLLLVDRSFGNKIETSRFVVDLMATSINKKDLLK